MARKWAALDLTDGARWSAGAYWAEDGNPQASDSDWADAATWDADHAYSSTDPIALGVFVAGVDVTDRVRQASWSMGSTEPYGTMASPSSAQLLLNGSVLFQAGDRVLVLTEWDKLWTGVVDSPTLVETAGLPDSVSLSCVDELSWASIVPIAAGTETFADLMEAFGIMLGAIGLPTLVYSGDPTNTDLPTELSAIVLNDNTVSGDAVSVMQELAAAMPLNACWTPYGLRIAAAVLGYDEDYSQFVTSLDPLAQISRTWYLDRVRNDWSNEGSNQWVLINEWLYPAAVASQASYGRRPVEIAGSDWWDQGVPDSLFWGDAWEALATGWDGAYPDFFQPLETVVIEAQVVQTRHQVTRYLPFDYLGDDTYDAADDLWRIMRISHNVSPDSWSVTLEGLAVVYEAPA